MNTCCRVLWLLCVPNPGAGKAGCGKGTPACSRGSVGCSRVDRKNNERGQPAPRDLASLPVALSLRARIAGRHGSGRSLAYSGVAIQRSWNSPKELRHADAKGRRMARLDHLHPRMEWESAMGPIAVGAADISSRVHRVWPSSSSMQPCSVVASLLVLLAQWSSRVYP